MNKPDVAQIESVLGVGGFDLSRILEKEPDFLEHKAHTHEHHDHDEHGEHEHDAHKHEHDDHEHDEPDHIHDQSVFSVSIVEDGAVDRLKLHEWMNHLLQTQGIDIFRMKGIINIAGEDHRFVFQGVHMIFDGNRDRLWKHDEARRSQLVFIGRNLNAKQLQQDFRSCLI